MSPPRKRQNLEDIKLIPEKDFEEAMRAVLNARPEDVRKKKDLDAKKDEAS